MSDFISIRCYFCQARIKAPAQLLGQVRSCPKCGTQLTIRLQVPVEEGPILVPEESPNQPDYQTW